MDYHKKYLKYKSKYLYLDLYLQHGSGKLDILILTPLWIYQI